MPTEQCVFLMLYIHGILYMYITKYSCVFLKLACMRSEGYSSRSVCLHVCLSTTILGLQTTRRLMSDTNS